MELEALEASWRRRRAQQEGARRVQAEAARAAARAAAAVLRCEFGADQVWLFGSLAVGPRHDGFDVDLAVRGLAPERQWAALARVGDLVGRSVDLVMLETCSERMRLAVAATGERIDE
jgi:uncharacterized protein